MLIHIPHLSQLRRIQTAARSRKSHLVQIYSIPLTSPPHSISIAIAFVFVIITTNLKRLLFSRLTTPIDIFPIPTTPLPLRASAAPAHSSTAMQILHRHCTLPVPRIIACVICSLMSPCMHRSVIITTIVIIVIIHISSMPFFLLLLLLLLLRPIDLCFPPHPLCTDLPLPAIARGIRDPATPRTKG